MTYSLCSKCGRSISIPNLIRHENSCDGKLPSVIHYKEIGLNEFQCLICNKMFSSKGIGSHIWRMHTEKGSNHHCQPPAGSHRAWNFGLTKETDPRVKSTGETFSKRFKLGLIGHSMKDRIASLETKIKLSDSMKIAHKEGRAWNIGMSRWNNKPSYPESFFMRVIENEFQDKQYIREYPMGRYSLDFAWEHLKRCIEIDGSQHERFEDVKLRDRRKDEFLIQSGWSVLRIKWSDMYKNPQEWILKAKNFIDVGFHDAII